MIADKITAEFHGNDVKGMQPRIQEFLANNIPLPIRGVEALYKITVRIDNIYVRKQIAF